jgi:RimJ/RimL family protein N-acetyltransferase
MTPAGAAAIDELRTPRLLLRRLCADDFSDLDRMHSDAQVMATLGGLRTAEQTRAFLDGAVAHWEHYGFGLWMARDRASGRFAGRGGLHHIAIDGQDEVEVAYAFLAEFWGRGLAPELAAESIRVAFHELQLSNLVCFTLPTNQRSRRVMEKVGFTYERDITHAGRPHVLYRLTR